jgi:iron complex outermembrane receptor protein
MAFVQAPVALAQEDAQTEESEEAQAEEAEEEEVRLTEGITEEITVTGTRVFGRSAVDTPAPVDYIDNDAIQSTGATETGKILQLLAPSFNFSSTTISDGTDIIRPATLRALGPDQVLVLVNGKRRHQQALLNVQQTIARGSAGTDINSIPASAIDHIEVLRDGATAQYGSDAIAGVINIILKDQADATDVTLNYGQHYESDGEIFMAGVNTGFSIGDDGFFNLTLEYRDRGETNRAGLATTNLLGWYTPEDFEAGVREVRLRIGDAESENVSLFFNTEIPAGDGELYAFGGYSNREGNSSGFYRGPNDGRTIPDIYPNGFLPTIITEPTDTSFALGYRGDLSDRWAYDVGINWGNSEFKFREENTANISYWYEPLDRNDPTGPIFGESPTEADTGTLETDQIGFTLDFTGVLDWDTGAGPLFVAAGAEWRQDGYKIEAGDPVSYQFGRTNDPTIQIFNQNGGVAAIGTQGFPGWSPREEVDDDRDSIAVYVDFESQLTGNFLGGVAVRFEDYSDFGSTVNGKLSGRIDLTDQFSLRATASTGFRAPGVQQAFYSQRSTNLNAQGVLTDTLTARQGGALTQAFGVPDLEEETSVSYSVGIVGRPADNFRYTVDYYRIDIDDRIIFSGEINPESGDCGTPVDPALCPIRAILDPFRVGQVQFFTNAIDTETQGLDIVAVQELTFGNDSLLTLEGALHFNDTEVAEIRSSSEILPEEVLFDDIQLTLVEEAQPGEHFVLGGTYYKGPVAANLRFNWFGEVRGRGFTGIEQKWNGKWLTDLTITYDISDDLTLSFGGTNIFDTFPDRWDPDDADPFPQLGFVYGWETLPFGINGGYYFGRLSYHFDH